MTNARARSIGWGAVLAVCTALALALTFRVNAVRSEVRLADRRIVALRQKKMYLETEFETRANQQTLKNLNDIDFGYQAPTAGQYVDGERALAALGKLPAADAPPPILMARAEGGPNDVGASDAGVAMVSPLTGRAMAAEAPRHARAAHADSAETLSARLSEVAHP